MKCSLSVLGGVVLLGFLNASSAATIWTESVSGDLSNNQATPSAFTLVEGGNSLTGTVGSGDNQDWIRLNVPAGFQLSSIILTSYASADAQGFTGVQAGTAFVGSVFTPGDYLGYAHFGTGAVNGPLPATNLIGADILPIMASPSTSPGSQGFTPPLAAGNYVFLIQQTGASPTAYQFDYNVIAVPEPCFLTVLGVVCIFKTRRRPSNRAASP